MKAKTLCSYVSELAKQEPGKHFLGNKEHWYTAAESHRIIRAAALQLIPLGIRPGTLVALQAERRAETVLMILALRATGALVCLTDPRQEIADALNECATEIRPEYCISAGTPGEYRVSKGGEVHTIRLGAEEVEDFALPVTGAGSTVSKKYNSEEPRLPEVSPEDPSFIIFTSGSTGKNKAVVLSEWNLISNILDSAPLGLYCTDDVALGALPLTHVFGLALLTGAAVLSYCIFFPETVSVPGLLDCIEQQGITRMNGVPSLYLALADQCEGRDVSSLRAGFIGGGPITRDQFAAAEEKLGMTLVSVYGMSECVGISCASYKDPREERAAGVGPVYPMNTVKILDAVGEEVPAGTEGEIFVNGPMRMIGYYGDPLPEEEFFPTGDLGYLDEKGCLHLSGRKKELIIRNGNNLSPKRIEEAILRLRGIRTCVVVGLPDEKEGEVPAAMIIGDYDQTALSGLLHKNEMPAFVLPVETIPMTATGKPDKQTIKEILLTCLNGRS